MGNHQEPTKPRDAPIEQERRQGADPEPPNHRESPPRVYPTPICSPGAAKVPDPLHRVPDPHLRSALLKSPEHQATSIEPPMHQSPRTEPRRGLIGHPESPKRQNTSIEPTRPQIVLHRPPNRQTPIKITETPNRQSSAIEPPKCQGAHPGPPSPIIGPTQDALTETRKRQAPPPNPHRSPPIYQLSDYQIPSTETRGPNCARTESSRDQGASVSPPGMAGRSRLPQCEGSSHASEFPQFDRDDGPGLREQTAPDL